MSIFRERPYLSQNFIVDLGMGDTDSVQSGFFEASLPQAYTDIVEYRSGNEKSRDSRKEVGNVEYSNVILKRTSGGSLDLYQWWDEVRLGSGERRTIRIMLKNENLSEVVMEWKLRNAIPVAHGFSTLNANNTAHLAEEIELAYETYELS